ncbi:hypothetical protein FHL15_001226 [Xylaria flabelliformis]|uniref:Cytochrome P450 n=1 Tax=Xylaria flabelliformis TaxID=2512241 RepID=A0A553ICU8_9PEZI|nr:hypothetical protein FHL15_001226 [Xylaria flabelliformis]
MTSSSWADLIQTLEIDKLRHLGSWSAIFALLVAGHILIQTIYNLYFHPLAKFPGPIWGRVSPPKLWRFWHTMRGRSHRAIQAQHNQHGFVVRVSPNELSFASVDSWEAIYGFRAPGESHFIKSEFYDNFGSGFNSTCIGSERDPKRHVQKKKDLIGAFSTRALNDQEALVQQCWDHFIEKIGPLSQHAPGGIDIVKWFEMAAFDALGEMAFGESFHCLEKDNLRRFTLVSLITKWLLTSCTEKSRRKHADYSRQKVQRRLDTQNARYDFFTTLASKVKSGEVPREEMTAHASTLIIAGGETTAHTLSSAIFYMMKTPGCKQKLFDEVRTRFKSYNEISATSTLQLPYLRAVINEALRIHPSGAQGFPRISPGAKINGYYIPPGIEVYTSAWTVTHDPANFHDPDIFKPQRWIDPSCGDIKEASQPFSLGNRACIGRNFAWMEMVLCLAKMAYKYDWEMVDKDLDWEQASRCYIMWWKAPIMMRLTDRQLE